MCSRVSIVIELVSNMCFIMVTVLMLLYILVLVVFLGVVPNISLLALEASFSLDSVSCVLWLNSL